MLQRNLIMFEGFIETCKPWVCGQRTALLFTISSSNKTAEIKRYQQKHLQFYSCFSAKVMSHTVSQITALQCSKQAASFVIRSKNVESAAVISSRSYARHLRCSFKIPWECDTSPHCILLVSTSQWQAHVSRFYRYKQGDIFVSVSSRGALHQSWGMTCLLFPSSFWQRSVLRAKRPGKETVLTSFI